MTDNQTAALAELKTRDVEARLLEHTAAVMSWDQETYMPTRAIEGRAAQLALLQTLVHERTTDSRIGELLATLGADEANPDGDTALAPMDRAFLRAKHRQYSKQTKLPARLVRELAQTASLAQATWARARRDDDFKTFLPHLERIIGLNQEVADHLGWKEQRYDALLDQYEPYALTSEVAAVFDGLQKGLVPLVQAIGAAEQVDDSFLHRSYPESAQRAFSDRLMVALGYELERGRLDRSAHPFTTTLGSDDVRITTRFDEQFLPSALFSTIHEVGHALYELGFDRAFGGTLLADGTSLGIHESQSRMWENVIGRSRPFWSHWLPTLRELFPGQLEGVELEGFYRAINKVQPSFIRVEADEVTYSLHVILRFRIEQALISGELKAAEAPVAWRELSKELLGVVPPTDRQGVLQDVHWSFGGFGYFPTYALGNLYAAQFQRRIEADLPTLWNDVAAGQYGAILAWLREHIHRHGRSKSAGQLVQEICGEPLSSQPFLDYLRAKYTPIYRL